MLKQFLRGVKRYTVDMLSLDLMSDKYHVLAANYIFLMVYATLESVFVNTLLYRITPDISIVILYRGITYVASAVTMHIGAYIGQKKSPILTIRIGAAIFLLMYVVLFAGMDYMHILMYLTAVLSGAGGAFYWAGHNMLVPHYTTAQNRDIGISILCIIQGAATLLVPIISGGVISLMDSAFGSPSIGYRIMFGIGMVIAAAQVRYQRKLPPVEQKKHESQIKVALRLFRRKLSYQYSMVYELLRGFRDGTFGFILNMILFEIITAESLVGVNAFLTGIMAITGAWAYGKLVHPPTRSRYVIIATTLMLVPCAFLLLSASAPVVMLFAMINSFFALFVSNAASNSTFDIFTQSAAAKKCVGESVAIREVCLGVGRISGLGVVMLFPGTMRGRICAMLVLTVSQYLIAVFIKLAGKSLERAKRHGAGHEHEQQAASAEGGEQ